MAQVRVAGRGAAWRAPLLGALAVVLSSLGVGAGTTAAGAAGILPPANPAQNVVADPSIFGPWTCQTDRFGTTCSNPCIENFPQIVVDNSALCANAALRAIDAARATEGVKPMALPRNWYSLTIPEQLFVVTNLERVDRGLPPFIGLAPGLNADAQAGANAGTDATFSQSFPAHSTATIWLSGAFSPLAADYGWMYSDGWGGPGPGTTNFTCSSPGSAGCWDHRDIILGAQDCGACLAGAAFAQSDAAGRQLSYAEEFIWPMANSPVPTFTWSADVAPFLGGAPMVGIARTADGGGYWLADQAGDVFNHGDAVPFGSLSGTALNAPIVSMAPSSDGLGYWLLGSDGGVFSFGDAGFHGSTGGLHLNAPVLSMAATPDGGGYWFVAADGGLFAFGDAGYFGSLPGAGVAVHNVVGIVPTKDNRGYWMVGSDGGVFAFGDAGFIGSLPGVGVAVHNVVGIVPTADDGGYWMVGSDGGVFAFGDAGFIGSMPGLGVAVNDIVGIAPTPSGLGYWMLGSDGGVFNFGNAGFYGSQG